MVNELLINLVDSVLGVGKKTSRGNKSYNCLYCNHHKPKLEINFSQHKKGFNPWHCWACDVRGNRISKLFKKIQASSEKFEELKSIIGNEVEVKHTSSTTSLTLPKELKSILGNNDILAKHAFMYLKNRGITKDDIEKYNIGYCEFGRYAKMVIIPSYDESGNLNFFTGRSFEKEPFVKYRNPEVSRDIVPFELFVNWNIPLILCEGPFDAMAIKRNAIPLLGKNIQENLMKKIVTSKVKKIYIALDNDAMKQALKFTEHFMNQGKEVYLVDLEGKDPSEMGFNNFTKLIQNTYPLNEYGLMERKLQLL
jgi:DNA primase